MGRIKRTLAQDVTLLTYDEFQPQQRLHDDKAFSEPKLEKVDTQKFLCEESSDDESDSEPVLDTIDGTDGPTVATTSSDTNFQKTTEVPRTTGDSGSTNEYEQQRFSNVSDASFQWLEMEEPSRDRIVLMILILLS